MNNRILIIGPKFYGYNHSVERGLKNLGYDTKVIDFIDIYPSSIKNKVILEMLPELGISSYKKNFDKSYEEGLNNHIIKVYNSFNPDLVFVIKGNKLNSETLRSMNKSKLVLWMMDSIFLVPETYKNKNYYDKLFMFEKTDVQRLEKENIKASFLPLALDESVYYPIDSNKKDIDILFVGELYEKRIEILETIIKTYPDLNIQIYGKYLNWKPSGKYINYFMKGYSKYFKNTNINPIELNKLYSRTKIALNIHHNQTKYGCNQRYFEILGSKTFQLVDYNEYIHDNFKENTHFGIFKDTEDLLNKIDYYNKNSSLRNDIAEAGYSEVIENHTFTKRLNYAIDIINRYLSL